MQAPFTSGRYTVRAKKVHLLVEEIAERLVPNMVQHRFHAERLELIYPDTIIIGELALGPDKADAGTPRGNSGG
jgi:hypothetical protein